MSEALQAHRDGRWHDAAGAYRAALTGDPVDADGWGNLGLVLRQLREAREAEACQRHAIALAPDNFSHRYNLGNLLREQQRHHDSVEAYRAAVALNPSFAPAHYNLALTCADLSDVADAKHHYAVAAELDPGLVDAHLNLGVLLEHEGVLSEAIARYQRVLALQPEHAAALNNISIALQESGRIEQSLAYGQAALRRSRDDHRLASNILMSMQYLPAVAERVLFDTAVTFGQRFPSLPRPAMAPVRGRPLRIGYVSADLLSHPVGLFLREVLPRHDRDGFEVFCYSCGERRDHVTDQIAAASRFRAVAHESHETLGAIIRADGVDVLVDLAGHTAGNRLPVFALRPAPVQISWLGYFATTGLPAMDFVVLDHGHAPPGTEQHFTERILRLPGNRFCYVPVPFAPEVAPPPFERNGVVTFGSFNNTAKVNDEVLLAWARILGAVDGSRLVLKWRTLGDPVLRSRIHDVFAAAGADPARVELRPASTHRELLEQYADVDVALDPFPFSGGHTSCEALWMGVPVVTLPQQRVVSRQTWSFLRNLGLQELAAADVEGYVNAAVALAKAPQRLRQYRQSLRERMRGSPLCDPAGFTRSLEAAYRLAWQTIAGAGEPAAGSGA